MATLTVAILIVPGGVQWSPAAAQDAVRITSVAAGPVVPLSSGFGEVRVDIGLESSEPLPDGIQDCWEGCAFSPVVTARRVGTDPSRWGEALPSDIAWLRLERTSGSPTSGTWTGTVRVSDVFTGRWQIERVVDLSTPEPWDSVVVSDREVVVDVGSGAAPPWAMVPAPVPVRVVTGAEMWVPRARLIDRGSGAGIAGRYRVTDENGDYGPAILPSHGSALDSAGYTAEGAQPVGGLALVVHGYGGRRSRGYSLEGSAYIKPQVKWQASARYSVSGRSVVVTGNAWPAPSVFPAHNPTIHLQQLVAGRWVNVGTSTVRANGRYTLDWDAGTDDVVTLRVSKPGGLGQYGAGSVGTQLAATTVNPER